MIDQRKRIFAVSMWIVDLLLTVASFFLAYRLRLLFYVPEHTVMDLRVYLWVLEFMVPAWAIILPLFRVYSEPGIRPFDQIVRLSKAIGIAWLVMAVVLVYINKEASRRPMMFVNLGILYFLLTLYRVF